MKTSSRRSTVTKGSKKQAPSRKKAPPVRTANLDKAIKDYEEALKVFARKEHTKAAHLFEAVIKGYPTEREVCDRSRVYLNICKSHTAAAASPKLKSPEDFYYQGVIAANDGRLDEATEMLDRVTKQMPKSDRAFYALATVCSLKGDRAAAIANLSKAIELSPANKIQALNNADFDALRQDSEFMALLGRLPEGNG